MRITIVGVTGEIGKQLVEQTLAEGNEVAAFARNHSARHACPTKLPHGVTRASIKTNGLVRSTETFIFMLESSTAAAEVPWIGIPKPLRSERNQ